MASSLVQVLVVLSIFVILSDAAAPVRRSDMHRGVAVAVPVRRHAAEALTYEQATNKASIHIHGNFL